MDFPTTDFPTTRPSMLRDIANPANQRRWDDFCKLYQRPLRDYALNYVPHDEVDDVVQRIFIEVFTEKLKYDLSSPKGTFHHLLKKAIRFRSIDAHRRRKTREKHLAPVPQPKDGDSCDHLANLPDITTGPASKVADREWSAMVPELFEKALKNTQDQVGLEQFQLFEHYVLREWPLEKVKRTFGVNRNQVYLAKSRVGQVFKKEFLKLQRAAMAVSPPASAKPAG